DYDTVPLILFWGLLFIWLMPWSAFVFRALSTVPLRKSLRPRVSIRTLDAMESTRLLLGLWAAIPMLFFSFSTRQEYYVLPALPALILLLADWLPAQTATTPPTTPHRKTATRPAPILAVIGLLAAAACLYLILHTRTPAPNTDLASLLRQNPGDY